MKTLIFIALAMYTITCLGSTKTLDSQDYQIEYEPLVELGEVVWGFDFLNNENIILTTRSGKIKILDLKTSQLAPVSGPPKVWHNGQGGLLDIRALPSDRSKIYLTYSKPIKGGATTALAMATLKNQTLTGLKDLFVAHKAYRDGRHFGSRIELNDKYVYFTVGDRGQRDTAQQLDQHTGKVIRLKLDGTVPADNPFVKQKNAKAEIWSYGHRSPQGLQFHPETGDLWLSEMGPRGGDEINVIKKGKNYGWPEVTYGREYYGPRIGVKKKSGTEQPITHWVPSISPSGMSFYSGQLFKKWKGNLLIGTLSGTHLRRVTFNGLKVANQEILLQEISQRIRNVRQGPDGAIYISTDSGVIARLTPQKASKEK